MTDPIEIRANLHVLGWEADAPKKDPETGARAPGEGHCVRCGEMKPLNRLRLCYQCFVYCEIEKVEGSFGRIWRPGMPHPSWCQCTLTEHVRSEPKESARDN